MSKQVENGIAILEYAIKNRKVLTVSCEALGFADNYFKDVKRRIKHFYENKTITKKQYDHFFKLHKEYDLIRDSIVSEIRSEGNNRSKEKKVNDLSDADQYDERSFYELERDEVTNKITKYKYTILVRDSDPITGELTREQMETIYNNYPYVNSNTCSSYFPYLTFVNFKKILRLFNITKDKLFPQHILDEKDSSEIAELGLKAKEYAALKKMVNQRPQFVEKSLRDTQKELCDLREEREYIESIIEKYYTNKVGTKNEPKTIIRKNNVTKNDKLNVNYCLFSDIHFGKKFDNPVFGRGYNKEIAHDRMMQIARKTVQYCKTNKSTKLIIGFLGDVIENFLENGMHPGHTQSMDLLQDDQIFFAVDSFEECMNYILKEIGNATTIKAILIGGNHDRSGEKRDEDKRRTASRIIFKILQRDFKDRIEIVIPENNFIKTVDNDLCLLGFHGDNTLLKRKPHEIVNLYGIGTSGYHLVVSGHFHRTKIEAGTNYMQISLPSVCSTDEYILNELGLNNLSGFLLGKKNENVTAFDYEFVNLY